MLENVRCQRGVYPLRGWKQRLCDEDTNEESKRFFAVLRGINAEFVCVDLGEFV